MTKKQTEVIEKLKESLGMKKNTKDALIELNKKDLKIGDKVFVENDLDDVEYKVLDIGDPFILIENEETRFAYLHRVNKLYKKIKKLND